MTGESLQKGDGIGPYSGKSIFLEGICDEKKNCPEGKESNMRGKIYRVTI